MEDLFAEEFDLEQMEAETEAMLALNYLDRSNSTFHRTEGGFVSLDTQEKHYNRVQVFRTFPFTGKIIDCPRKPLIYGHSHRIPT